MLEHLFISKKEIGKLKLKVDKPFNLTPEKIAQNPRAFDPVQIKSAIDNIIYSDKENLENPLFEEIARFIHKDFFFLSHQTGLYNRQLKLWKALGNISIISFFKLQKGLVKKNEIDVLLIEFLTSSGLISARAIFPLKESDKCKLYLSFAIGLVNSSNLKGIFYVVHKNESDKVIKNLELKYDPSDPVSRYESIIPNTNDVRLNIISLEQENDKNVFEHIYPSIAIRGAKNE